MKIRLLFKEKDFIEKFFYNLNDLKLSEKINDVSLERLKDLGLEIVLSYMSKNDKTIYEVSKFLFCNIKTNVETIRYRQEILKDIIVNRELIRKIYDITFKVKEEKIKNWLGIFGIKTPSNIVYNSRELLQIFILYLEKLRDIAKENINKFKSSGLKNFFTMLLENFSDSNLLELKQMLNNLKFEKGLCASAKIIENIDLFNYELVYLEENMNFNILKQKNSFYFKINPKDEAGAKIVESIKNTILKDIANILYNASLNIELFFNKLQIELSFYIGALNLIEFLEQNNYYYCFPDPLNSISNKIEFEDLFDLSLFLVTKTKLVANSFKSDNKNIFIISGANKGGKTTFLRSIGIAQILMQSGLIVPAKLFKSNIYSDILTHFKKEEDKNLTKGKFEEEVCRINNIISNLKCPSLLLFNESFSSTNEMEASEIAYNIILALSHLNNTIFYVTHLHSLPTMLIDNNRTCFLIAEILNNKKRTYKIIEGAPSKTSYAIDLLENIFKSLLN
ncbi:MAG: DNA mismatch repair protein MutS [Spirochaetes bacterium]|nr:DNA mismatch repair protein MutS [Spirochaetota bacterium]